MSARGAAVLTEAARRRSEKRNIVQPRNTQKLSISYMLDDLLGSPRRPSTRIELQGGRHRLLICRGMPSKVRILLRCIRAMGPGLPLRTATELTSSAGQDPAAKYATKSTYQDSTRLIQEVDRATGPLGLHWATASPGNCPPSNTLAYYIQYNGWAGLGWASRLCRDEPRTLQAAGPRRTAEMAHRRRCGVLGGQAGQRKPHSGSYKPSLFVLLSATYYTTAPRFYRPPPAMLVKYACAGIIHQHDAPFCKHGTLLLAPNMAVCRRR